MFNLARAVLSKQEGGEPIPTPWAVFDQHRMLIRRGESTLIAGPPGSLKTCLALEIARQPTLTCLYICADTGWRTILIRLLTALANDPATSYNHTRLQNGQAHVEELVADDPAWVARTVHKAVGLSFDFSSAPATGDVADMLEAYAEVHGQYPDLVVIDSMYKVDAGDDEWGGMREAEKGLNHLARDYNTAMLVLAHTGEVKADASCPPARGDVQGKVAKTFNLIVTLLHDRPARTLKAARVKSRDGDDDPSGHTYVTIKADANTMCFTDL